LFIGRIIKSKGLREAISSLSKIDNEYNLVVCGDGPDLDICRSMATDLGVSHRIKFVGWTNKKEKEMYLAGTKVVVFPSMGPESFGLVGLEAMFYQKPVVAFNSGGINQWLENGENGFLIERGNTDQMAEYLNKILVSKSLRNEMGTKGRIILDTEFSLEKHISGLMEIYSRVKRQKY
jgi:glycosyltransferase involved in cell wall biosynthesis